jgi:predicted XRE-type DNA-binding protein
MSEQLKLNVPNLEHFEAFKQELVQELEQLRHESGASQETIATLAGITRKRVMHLSHFDDILKVAHVLGVDVEFKYICA